MDSRLPNRRLSKELPDHNEQETDRPYTDRPVRFSKTDSRGKPSLDLLNEASPLLSPQRRDDDESPIASGTPADELDYLDGEEQAESKSHWYLFVLTLSIGG